MTVPRMVGGLGNTGAFGFYAGLNIFSFVVIFLLMPGTNIIHYSAQIFLFFFLQLFF